MSRTERIEMARKMLAAAGVTVLELAEAEGLSLEGPGVKPRLYTTEEAAKYLGVSTSTLRRLDDLPRVNLQPNTVRYSVADLDALIDRLKS